MLSVKQGDIKYHFLFLWYDSTWEWTEVSRATGEQTTKISQPDFELSSQSPFVQLWVLEEMKQIFTKKIRELKSSWNNAMHNFGNQFKGMLEVK